jgi:2-(1,2-epoxy-1,2-dihydrophenyl)acetyl-CoA isomerase
VNQITGLGVDQREGVLNLTLDRPDKRNAITDEILGGLIEAIEWAGQDEAVRVVVIRGAGEHFCAGFDLVGRNTVTGGRPRAGSIQRRLPVHAHRLLSLIANVQTPVVAVVRGWAAGLGLHLVLAADFAVVADDARLWEPFLQRGFTPDSGGTWMLPRRVGEIRAREMLLLGRTVNGKEAAEWGMVHRSVPETDLERAAGDVIAQLATSATVALGLTKWLLHAGAGDSLESQLEREALAIELSSRSEDFREGLAAFKEKRDPRFTGR